jgi:hypothetical protein
LTSLSSELKLLTHAFYFVIYSFFVCSRKAGQ